MKRINKKEWLNIGILCLFLISAVYLLYIFFRLCFSVLGLTTFGTVITILAIFIFVEAGTYFYEKLK